MLPCSEPVELWVKYRERESIVEKFKAKGRWWVREIWPRNEPREHAVQWSGAGYSVLPRKVYMTDASCGKPSAPAEKGEWQ